MLKITVYVLFVFVLLISPIAVFAENETTENAGTTTPSVTKSPKQLREALKERKDVIKEELKDNISAARENFKERMAAIKDERKKMIVENIDSKIQNINTRRTQHMLEHLTKISEVLERIKANKTELDGQGKDTASLSASITAAQTAIDKAKTAVQAQSLKEYNAVITTDASLKNAITTILNQFKKDIKAVFDLVLAARKAVINARKEAQILKGEASGSTVSPTGIVSPTALPTQ